MRSKHELEVASGAVRKTRFKVDAAIDVMRPTFLPSGTNAYVRFTTGRQKLEINFGPDALDSMTPCQPRAMMDNAENAARRWAEASTKSGKIYWEGTMNAFIKAARLIRDHGYNVFKSDDQEVASALLSEAVKNYEKRKAVSRAMADNLSGKGVG